MLMPPARLDAHEPSRFRSVSQVQGNTNGDIERQRNLMMSHVFAQMGRAAQHFNPRSKERYYTADKWNDSWSHGYDLNKAQEDARYGVLMALIQRFQKEGPLLDVGCGDGLLEERYRKLGDTRIVAFDYSATAIEHAMARQLPNVDFLCADSRTFRPEEKFSIVIFNESLYYADNYLDMMKDLSRSLKRDGVFIVSMHGSPITKRIWKNVLKSHILLQGVCLKDEITGGLWHIRSLRPAECTHPSKATLFTDLIAC
jgi:2-polyprenyl-3-methyl-5-hydroxy-6-metoxy-1,4-benzoquinol methylase